MHAILALSMQHVCHMKNIGDDDALTHRAKDYKDSAVSLYSSAIEKANGTAKLAFLDATLILCTLEVRRTLHEAGRTSG